MSRRFNVNLTTKLAKEVIFNQLMRFEKCFLFSMFLQLVKKYP